MAIYEWPVEERPRERLLEYGAEALTDAELLALVIRCGAQGLSAVDIARKLLSKFGSMTQFLRASQKECLAHLAIGPARLASVKAALEIARRCHLESLQSGVVLKDSAAIRTFLLRSLKDRGYETFCILHLDGEDGLIKFDELFRGTVDGASVYPREVMRQVVEYGSKAVVLAHNHPSGCVEPSKADVAVTKRLKETLALIDVPVLDHFVVGEVRCVSLAQRGLM